MAEFNYTPAEAVAELARIGITGINPDFVTIVKAQEETDDLTGTSQMILVEIDQPFETVEDLQAWGKNADSIDRDNVALGNFFHNEWHGLVNKNDENDIRLHGKVAYILGEGAVEIAREMFQMTHNPLDALMRSMLSGAGLPGRGSVDEELAALLAMLSDDDSN